MVCFVVQVFSLRTINPINISSWITNNLTNIADYTYIATQGQTNFGGAAYAAATGGDVGKGALRGAGTAGEEPARQAAQ